MNLGKWSLKHPVPLGVITAGAVLFGILSLATMNVEFVPSLVMPSVTVVSLWPGVAAEDVDSDITGILEDRFATIAGLTDMSSDSREGVSIINLEFSDDTSSEASLQEVRNRVDLALADLPDGMVGKPAVNTFGAADLPVMSFSVSGIWDHDGLARYVEEIVRPAIYRIDGVARVNVLGERRQELTVRLDTESMSMVNVALPEVAGAIRNRNTSLPSGLVDWKGSAWTLDTSGRFRSTAEVRNLIVGGSPAAPVRLRDIADVSIGYAPADEVVLSGAGELVAIQVSKKESGNAIRISREVRRRLSELEKRDSTVEFRILHDDRKVVSLALRTVMSSALFGIVMAIIVIWVFLRSWRWTMVIAAALPTSLVVAFIGMRLTGQTINVLTMAGVTVSLGMIVDASIVVLENIHRISEKGGDPETAAIMGSEQVSGAVIASVSTSVSVFAPMLFLSGIIGIVLKDLSLTLLFCLASSLLAALFLVPSMAARWIRRRPVPQEARPHRKKRTPGLMKKLEATYRRALERALAIRGTVVFAAVVLLAVSAMAAGLMGVSFMPAADYGELFVAMELPPGSNLEDGVAASEKASEAMQEQVPEIADMVFYVGMENDLAGESRQRESVWCQVLLKPKRPGGGSFRDVMDRLRKILPEALPGVAVSVYNGGFDRMVSLALDGAGYRVELSSESDTDLMEAARRVEELLYRNPDVMTVSRDISRDRRTVTARMDGEELGRLGIDASATALTTLITFDGLGVGDYRPDGDEDIPIRLAGSGESGELDASTLAAIPVRGASGMLIPLDVVAEIVEETSVSGLRRRNRARTLTVIAETRDENVRDINRRLEAALEAEPLEGVEWKIRGASGLISDSLSKLAVVLVISLFLVYAVMAIQFERVVQPLIIMASVPFCFIGVVGGLAVFGSDLSLVSFVGIVALAGIVVNNAIVQIDRINFLRKKGMDMQEAVLAGAVGRLRPVLMTTLTTFFGILPLALARGGGARIYAPLGQAIAGGLFSSTLVTLFLIPTLYMLTEKPPAGAATSQR